MLKKRHFIFGKGGDKGWYSTDQLPENEESIEIIVIIKVLTGLICKILVMRTLVSW